MGFFVAIGQSESVNTATAETVAGPLAMITA